MTLRSFRDLEAICRQLKLLPAKLDCPSVNSSRVKCYAYSLFTHGGYPRMGYKYGSIRGSNQLHSLF